MTNNDILRRIRYVFDFNDAKMMAIFALADVDVRRGKKDGTVPKPERQLTNNIILMKLKIALNLQSEDMIEIAQLAGFTLSTHELSSFMRRPGHRN